MPRERLPEEVLKFFRDQGRIGGLKGGNARAAKLTPKRRKEIASKAAAARWGKEKKKY